MSASPLQLHIGRSVNQVLLCVSVHGLAATALFFSQITVWLRISLLLLVCASAIWQLTKQPHISHLIYLPDCGWRCQYQSGDFSAWCAVSSTVVWPHLAMIYLVNDAEKITVNVWRDAITESEFRRLSVVLTDARTYRQ